MTFAISITSLSDILFVYLVFLVFFHGQTWGWEASRRWGQTEFDEIINFHSRARCVMILSEGESLRFSLESSVKKRVKNLKL
ncbi:hypothetical protein HYC85_031663 [Camellia sinensis]|uniref:Uncharacterized protein n=1 Tax=Camellia sinensis TaxID=4442 RepID=A0A7J7FR46_CAMSI|nr:hypothetical protein HYC85_031663 [Camellia sinensis]